MAFGENITHCVTSSERSFLGTVGVLAARLQFVFTEHL